MRQICHYFARALTFRSVASIGELIGNKDHATVLHSIKTVIRDSENNKLYKLNILELESIFNQKYTLNEKT